MLKKHRRFCAPIRTGCYVEFVQRLSTGYERLCSGYVQSHAYSEEGYHNFTIKSDKGHKSVTVSGATLYQNLIKHVQGEESRIVQRRAVKRGKRRKKLRERHQQKHYGKPRKRSGFSRKFD